MATITNLDKRPSRGAATGPCLLLMPFSNLIASTSSNNPRVNMIAAASTKSSFQVRAPVCARRRRKPLALSFPPLLSHLHIPQTFQARRHSCRATLHICGERSNPTHFSKAAAALRARLCHIHLQETFAMVQRKHIEPGLDVGLLPRRPGVVAARQSLVVGQRPCRRSARGEQRSGLALFHDIIRPRSRNAPYVL